MINSNSIYCGDAVRVLQDIPSDSVDLTITCPPEDIVGHTKDRLAPFVHAEPEMDKLDTLVFDINKVGHYINIQNVAQELFRVTKLGGVVVWILGDWSELSDVSLRPFRHVFQFRTAGFDLHETLINLHKQKKQPPKTRHVPIFDYMFVFSKGYVKTFNPVEERVVTVWEPLREDAVPNAFVGNFKEEIPHDLISMYSKEGEIVLDPFCGSGTTLVCAKRLNRQYIGIDVMDEYCKQSEARLNG